MVEDSSSSSGGGGVSSGNASSVALTPLPSLIADAISTLRWPLVTAGQHYRMKLLPLHSLDPPVLPTCGEIPALELAQFLCQAATGTSTAGNERNISSVIPNSRNEHWSMIAAALILLGHGYVDHAHNLIGPLSYHSDLPYFQGPPVVVDPEVLAAASYVHCLVHRREGQHRGEFGQTGYENSNFWASATLRSGGEETLPLVEIARRIEDCALAHGLDAQQWCRDHCMDIVELWDPRPLTGLCGEIIPVQSVVAGPSQCHPKHLPRSRHPLHEFAQQAALVEIEVLLQHALDKLGFLRVHEATHLSSSQMGVRLLAPTATPTIQLPKTFQEAVSSSFGGPFKDDAIVVTTAASPHQIVFVNDAWVDMCGYSKEVAQGKTFSILQGDESNTTVARLAAQQCFETRMSHEVFLVNYTAAGERFVNHVTMGPLYADSADGDGNGNGSNRRSVRLKRTHASSPRLQYMVAILKRPEHGSDTALAA
ncbi:MAG: hypothetical protein SGILL_001060 [Bacillariaceae sp.]